MVATWCGCPHKLCTKEGEKGHTTHVKQWKGRVRQGKLKPQQIMLCSMTQLAHAHHRPTADEEVVPIGHSVSTPKQRYQWKLVVRELPDLVKGHLKQFMRSDCQCSDMQLPDLLYCVRSMKITIGNPDGSLAARFRLHAHGDHYEGPWYDFVECDVTVGRHGLQNMIGECHHLGHLRIPAGPRKGQLQHFVYVERLLADTDGGVHGAVRRIRNPGYPAPGYTLDHDRQAHNDAAAYLENLGVRTVEHTQVAGCYLTPSSCHGLALLQPGFYEPEDGEHQVPDFFFVVNSTLMELFK